MSPRTQNLVASLCPFPLTGVRNEDLADVLDAWLADEFASESHRHIHDYDNESTNP